MGHPPTGRSPSRDGTPADWSVAVRGWDTRRLVGRRPDFQDVVVARLRADQPVGVYRTADLAERPDERHETRDDPSLPLSIVVV
jgi:hypothetical protein